MSLRRYQQSLMYQRFCKKFETVGWRGIPSAALRSAQFRATRVVAEFYWNHVVTNHLLGKLFPFKQPAILLLSYPRSGSDWIASILRRSPGLAYLREPINQGIRYAMKNDASAAHLTTERKLTLCESLSDLAFAGIPSRELPQVVENIADFRLLARKDRTLLIKEVIPMVAEVVVNRHAPKTVILLRHPAAIADSFARMGWLAENPEDFAYHYGLELNQAIDAGAKGWSTVVLYEQLAKNPLEEFTRLFLQLDLPLPPKLPQIISDFCTSPSPATTPYETRRSTHFEIDKWKKNLSKATIEAVMQGYLRSPLPYYREPSWWQTPHEADIRP